MREHWDLMVKGIFLKPPVQMVKKFYAFMELTVHYSVRKKSAIPLFISYSSDKIKYYPSIFHMVSSLETFSPFLVYVCGLHVRPSHSRHT
jgi:hypothetical protein